MAGGNKSFYDVLDVPHDADETEIALAYRRLLARMRKEDAAPNPRLLAMAKVAHETLVDADRRAEYDATLGIVRGKPRKRWLAALAILVALAGAAAYLFFARGGDPAPAAKGPAATTPRDVAQQVAPSLGRLSVALMSGEVRAAGTAVALGEGEMAVLCRGVVAGALLTVKVGEHSTRAEVAKANPEADICILGVKTAAPAVRLRTGNPPPTEPLHAVVFDSNGAAVTRAVSTVRPLDDAHGPRFEIKSAAALPDGTPVFDAQARLVAITAATPGEAASAIGAARIAALRPAPTSIAAGNPPSTGTTRSAPAVPATASTPSPAPPARARSGGGLGTMVGEGFTTLWREDEDLQISEVLDDARKGYIGLPLAYWTRWEGRDPESPMVVGCRISLGDVPIYTYEQATIHHKRDGYFYCALAPTMMDLNTLPKGEYTFEIFVNGRPLAESSIRVERRIMTPTAWMVITLLAGFGLLAFVRRNKAAT